MSFETVVLEPVKRYLGRRATIPNHGTWTVSDRGDEGIALGLAVSTDDLCANLQTDRASMPSRLWMLAYWLERATSRAVRCRVSIDPAVPEDQKKVLHWRRSQFLLDQYSAVLGDRFVVEPSAMWEWPRRPIVNHPESARESEGSLDASSEAELEGTIVASSELRADFDRRVSPLAYFERQLPIGLFDGRVGKGWRWTPGGKSGVDLWGRSPDGSCVHLFELKKKLDSPKVGILPEAFYYLRLWHLVRVGLPDGGRIEAPGEGGDAMRAARRIVMWLTAPNYHPLVAHGHESPLEWLNAGMGADGARMQMLPFVVENGVVAWRPLG